MAAIVANIDQHYRTVIQNQASIIGGYLDGVSTHLRRNQDILSSLNAYPLPTFPGHTQQGLLDQLLRKRVEPSVEDWLDRGRHTAESTFGAGQDALTAEELRAIWQWAPLELEKAYNAEHFHGDYTRAEVETGVDKVKSGLRRRLNDNIPDPPKWDENGHIIDEDDDEEDEEDEEDEGDEGAEDLQVVGARRRSNAPGIELAISKESDKPPAMKIGHVYNFMMTGTVPSAV